METVTKQQRESAIKKLVKLLELAEHPSTPEGEKAAALHQASKLMEKYGLSRSDTSKAGMGEDEYEIEGSPLWLKQLYAGVGRILGVATVWGENRFIVVGTEVDREIYDYTLDVLFDSIVSKGEDYRKELKASKQRATQKIINDFQFGMAMGILENLKKVLEGVDYREMNKGNVNAGANEKSMVVVNKDKFDNALQWYKDQGNQVVNSRARVGNLNGDAVNAGREASSGVRVSAAMNGGNSQRYLS